MKFRKKPVVIEAEQISPDAKVPIDFVMVKGVCLCNRFRHDEFLASGYGQQFPHVHTIHNGQMVGLEGGDWVVPEPDGEHYYPVKPDIFDAAYEPVHEFDLAALQRLRKVSP